MVFETLEPRCLLTAQTFNLLGSAVTLDSSQYDAGSIIVTLRQGAKGAADSLAASLSSGQVAFSDSRALGQSERLMEGIYQVSLAPGIGVSEAIAAFQYDTSVLAAEPNLIAQIDATPTDPSFRDQWGLDNRGLGGPTFGTLDADIDAPEAWNITTGSGNFVIAVIDTGVDYTHPDLNDNMWVNPGEIAGNGIDDDHNGFIDDIRGWDFISNDNNPLDENGHGTHVAGTIAAEGDNGYGTAGVIWRAKIMALKIFDSFGVTSLAAEIGAIDYAVKMGARVSNNSWGGPGANSALLAAISRAHDAGHVFVAAAGNGGPDVIGDNNDLVPNFPSNYTLDNVVAVAAMDRFDELADFSNYGPISVDLAAPGVQVLSTRPSYTVTGTANTYFGLEDGTSMAAPHVAGAIALLWDKFPNLSYQQVISLILNNVRQVPSLSGLVKTGGVLDIYSALVAAGGLPGGVNGSPDPAAPTPVPAIFNASLSNTTDVRIPDRKSGSSSITVSQHIAIGDVDVWVDIRHPSDKQLTIALYRPGYPVPVILAKGVGGTGDHFSVTTFDDEAVTAITAGAAPFNGSFKPQNSLTTFDGFDSFGTWKLVVSDTVKGSLGLINAWGITIQGIAPTGVAANVNWSFDASPSGTDQAALLAASEFATAGRSVDSGKLAAYGSQLTTQRFAERPALKISAQTLSPAAVDCYFAARRSEARADIPETTLLDDECGQLRLAGIEAA